MRVLLTGRGSIAQRHARLLRQALPSVMLAVVSGAGAAGLDPSFGPCQAVVDFAAGLAWGPQAVVIASVSSRHAQELQRCLELGLPCLAEKPLVTSRAELAGLLEAAAGPDRAAVVVGCNLRYLPALGKLAALLRGGELGRIVRAQLEVGQDLMQWRPGRSLEASYSADASAGGGVVFDLVHEIDMANWLLGPLRVRAAIGGHLSVLPIRSDDVHVALLEQGNGAPVVVSLDYVSRQPVRRYAIVAEQGTVTCDIMKRELLLHLLGETRVLAADPADFDVGATYSAQMRDWLGAIGEPDRAVVSPLRDAFAAASLMLSMKEAAA